MDFTIRNLFSIELFGMEIWVTQTIVNTWIIMALLVVGAVVVRIKLGNMKETPGKLQNVIEAIVETFDNFVRDFAGEKFPFAGNWFFMVFAFVLISNLSGLVGFRPPTADWGTTFALALATLVLIQVAGIRARGFSYIKSFFQPTFILFPLNLIGELARPVSLSFRLFGNMLAGFIVLSLMYSITPLFARLLLPLALHAYFDVFAGVLQTFIFCAVSLSFIGASSATEQ